MLTITRSLFSKARGYFSGLSAPSGTDRITTFSEAPGIAREIRYYLEEHYAEEVSLEVLAAHFHLAPEYLCERFKAETHQTIMKTLRGIRIHHAKIKLLEMPDIGLAEVGRLCGVRSPSYFGKVFRESTGFTPQAYRLGAYL